MLTVYRTSPARRQEESAVPPGSPEATARVRLRSPVGERRRSPRAGGWRCQRPARGLRCSGPRSRGPVPRDLRIQQAVMPGVKNTGLESPVSTDSMLGLSIRRPEEPLHLREDSRTGGGGRAGHIGTGAGNVHGCLEVVRARPGQDRLTARQPEIAKATQERVTLYKSGEAPPAAITKTAGASPPGRGNYDLWVKPPVIRS